MAMRASFPPSITNSISRHRYIRSLCVPSLHRSTRSFTTTLAGIPQTPLASLVLGGHNRANNRHSWSEDLLVFLYFIDAAHMATLPNGHVSSVWYWSSPVCSHLRFSMGQSRQSGVTHPPSELSTSVFLSFMQCPASLSRMLTSPSAILTTVVGLLHNCNKLGSVGCGWSSVV